MAVKEIYLLRLIATFGPLRRSKSNLMIILALPLIGLSLVPIIFTESSYGQFFVDILLQYPVLLVFPLLFLSSVLVSRMSVTEYERDFIFSSTIRPSDFLLAKTLYDITVASFLFFLPLIIPFALSIMFLKMFYILLFSSILAILLISVVLENSFKTFILFYSKNLVRASTVAVMLIFSLPLLSSLYPETFPFWLYYISPVGCLQALVKENNIVAPIISLSSWTVISLALLIKASRLNFIPYAQVVPLRTMFDISLSSQVRKQQYVLSRVGAISLPLEFAPAPKNMVLFFVKESITRSLRFGDIYTLLLTTFFLYIPYIFLQPRAYGAGSLYQLSFSPTYFIIIFYPMIFTQLWFTEASECVWIVKTYLRESASLSLGLFLWQLSLTVPIVFAATLIESFLKLSDPITSFIFSTLALTVNSAFSVFYSFWLFKRKAFTPYMFFVGIIFYILLSMPFTLLLLLKELVEQSIGYFLYLISVAYTSISLTVLLYKASKIFEEIEL